jgi:hypothetical protein
MTPEREAEDRPATAKVFRFPSMRHYRTLERQAQVQEREKQQLQRAEWELMMAEVMAPITRGLCK